MTTAVIKYNAGNIQSVIYALERLGLSPVLTDDPETIHSADKVIFPGQGEASSAMRYLRQRGLDKVIKNLKQPVLGICVGLQLLCRHSEEGNADCLGVFDLLVKRFPPHLKVPHMGWNSVNERKGALYNGLRENATLYYVHSYYAEIGDDTTATNDYILPYSAALEKDNFYAIQPHLEKSGKDGERILKNFLDL
jgi:glutamine amidotransferase